MNKSTLAFVTTLSLLLMSSSVLARGEHDGGNRGGERGFSREGSSGFGQGGAENRLRGPNAEQGGFRQDSNNANPIEAGNRDLNKNHAINNSDNRAVDNNGNNAINNSGNRAIDNNGNNVINNSGNSVIDNNGNTVINTTGDKAITGTADGYYIHNGVRYQTGAYYYGPGLNQTWCANNATECANWCLSNASKCTSDGTNYYIISPQFYCNTRRHKAALDAQPAVSIIQHLIYEAN